MVNWSSKMNYLKYWVVVYALKVFITLELSGDVRLANSLFVIIVLISYTKKILALSVRNVHIFQIDLTHFVRKLRMKNSHAHIAINMDTSTFSASRMRSNLSSKDVPITSSWIIVQLVVLKRKKFTWNNTRNCASKRPRSSLNVATSKWATQSLSTIIVKISSKSSSINYN